jgi:hypothetical protein
VRLWKVFDFCVLHFFWISQENESIGMVVKKTTRCVDSTSTWVSSLIWLFRVGVP